MTTLEENQAMMKRVEELLQKGADISEYQALPEAVRNSDGATKAILPVFTDFPEDAQVGR